MSVGIRTEAASCQLLKERLQTEFPDAEDQTLHDTLDGLSDLREMLATITRSYLDDRAFATALRQRIADMNERLGRYDHRAERKKALLAEVMGFAGLKKLTEPDFTLSLRPKQPSVVVTDEAMVPEAFWIPQAPKLDKQGLKDVLKRGQDIPGATLDNGGESVAVRTK